MILSVSSVSAGIFSDDNSLNLMDTDEINDLSEFNGENLGDNCATDSFTGTLSVDANLVSDLASDTLTDDDTNNPNGPLDDSSDEGGNTNPVDDDNTNPVDDDNTNPDDNENDDPNENEDPIEDPTLNTTKNTTLTIVSPDNWKIYGDKNYTVKLMDEDNNPVVNASIYFKIKNPKGNYVYKTCLTNEKGKAVLPLQLSLRGIHTISVSYEGDSDYNPAQTVNSTVKFYEKTVIKTSKYSYRSCNLTIRLLSAKGDPLAKKKLVVYIDGVKYTRTTDSNGKIYIKMPSDKKMIKLNCTFSSSDYYESSKRIMDLPVYKKTYTKPLVYAILKGQNFKILLKGIDGKILKKEKVIFTINGKNFTKTTTNKGIAYLKVNFKRNEYEVKFSYGNNSVYGPSSNSSILCVIDPSGQYKKGLNQKTKLSVYKYLSGGGTAKVTKSIRNLAKKLTKNCHTRLEKATAIFNYVRDTLNYEYYANSRKGAYKTMKTKAGNCCDHANLIVALCRASKIPARFSHAQGCRFKKSGRVEGHVWAQIRVGKKWYSADGTSYRNSLGHIENWDTKSYYRLHIYRRLPF